MGQNIRTVRPEFGGGRRSLAWVDKAIQENAADRVDAKTNPQAPRNQTPERPDLLLPAGLSRYTAEVFQMGYPARDGSPEARLAEFGKEHRSPVDVQMGVKESRTEVPDLLTCVIAEHLQKELGKLGYTVTVFSEVERAAQRQSIKERPDSDNPNRQPMRLLVSFPNSFSKSRKMMGLEVRFGYFPGVALSRPVKYENKEAAHLNPDNPSQRYRIGYMMVQADLKTWSDTAVQYLQQVEQGKATSVQEAVGVQKDITACLTRLIEALGRAA